MRMTYRQFFEVAQAVFTDEQWDSDMTVEDSETNECFPASLRIAGEEHDSLDENHPVVWIEHEECERATQQDIFDLIKSFIG